MVKRKSSPVKKPRTTTKREKRSSFLVVAVAVIVILSVIVLGSWGIKATIDANNQARLDRIKDIYTSLQLNEDDYKVVEADVFGEKRAYEWDAGRSYSSVIRYVHGDTVNNTFNELDEKIRSAGFTFVDEPYPSLPSKQYHYKSEKGEYVRLTVSSKVYDDASFNASVLNKSIPAAIDQDKAVFNQAPANVTIKVNLDDNNE